MSATTRTPARLALAALVAASLLASCGSDDEAAPATTTEAASTTEADATTTSAAAAADGTVEVSLVDYKFEGLPESVEAGTTFTIANDSEKELHEMVVLRIPEDEKRPIDELAQLPDAELESIFAGEPAMVLLAPPGGEQITAVGDGSIDEPGRYAVICAIPTGVDPEAYLNAPPTPEGPPELPEGAGPPHFMQGMYAQLIVT